MVIGREPYLTSQVSKEISIDAVSEEASLRSLLQIDLSWAEPLLLVKYRQRKRRPPHPPLAMLRALIYQRMKQIRSWRKLASTIKAEPDLAAKLGFTRAPCHDAFSEFARRIGCETLFQIFRGLVERIRRVIPELGTVIALDSTLVRAYSKPGKRGERKTDANAAWGVSGEKLGKPVYVYGYKLHVACDPQRDIPLSFMVAPANRNETRIFPDHIRLLMAQGYKPDVLTADAGYDSKRNNLLCIKYGIKPVIAINPRRSAEKTKRKADYLLPIPRGSPEWRYYYSMRSSIERIF